jgi:hypothetical protein
MFNSTFLLIKNAFSNQVTYDLISKNFLANLFHHSWRVSFISSLSISSSLFSKIFHHISSSFFLKAKRISKLLWPILCQKPGTFIFRKQLSGSDTIFTNNAQGGYALSFSYMFDNNPFKNSLRKKSNQVLYNEMVNFGSDVSVSHASHFILISLKMNMLSQNMACVF